MYSVRQLKWNEVHSKWNDIKFPEPYQQYLQEAFGLTVTNGRVLWGHVVEVTLVPTGQVGGKAPDEKKPKKKDQCKEIKLIFIMDDIHKEQTKYVQDNVSAKLVSDIQNNIEEQLQTKISLSDVQIIEG
jgi:hypothetical protein